MKRSVLAPLLGITLLSAGCSSSSVPQPAAPVSAPTSADDTDAAPASGAACDRPTPHPELAARLPAGFPTAAGWQPTELVTQGATQVVRGVLPGEPADLPEVRDRAADRLTGAGYRQTGSDAEAGFEAEADLSGPYQVNISVRPLCRGYLQLSYSVRR